MTRVLVLSCDVVPLPGLPTVGGGLRSWTLARGLETAGYDVTLSFPREPLEALAGQVDAAAIAAAQPYTFNWSDPAAAVAVHQPEVVVCASWLLASQFSTCPVPMAVDVAGPVLLEFLHQGKQKGLDLAARKPQGLALADFVVCAGERQRAYFAAWLLIAGFTPQDCATRLATMIMSAPPAPRPPHGPPNAEPVIIFAGVALPWHDPLAPLKTVAETLERCGRGQLEIHLTQHPIHSQNALWYGEFVTWAEAHPRVTIFPGAQRTHSAVLDLYRRADLAFDLFGHNLERELAVANRTVEYLSCGLPVLHSSYSELAEPIGRYEAGVAVDPADQQAVAAAIEQVLMAPETLRRWSENASRLTDELLTWDKTIAPLAAWCAVPSRRQPGEFTPAMLLPDYERQQELLQRLAGTEDELARAKTLAETRKEYAGQVEAAWNAQGEQLAALDRDLAAWRAAPFRSALRHTLSRTRSAERGTRN
ncbi:MAG: glycosyltransferase [Thermomicrobiales bacterium]